MAEGFRAALLDASRPVPVGLTDGRGGVAGRRFAIYRNNVAVGLRDALVEGFPTIERLIGTENLQGVAGVFLRQSPPDSPVMFRYGAEFPAFLERFSPLAHLGYLPDAARLDLAMRSAYHAADSVAIAPGALSDLPADTLASARLRLAPSVRLLRSAWPLHDIWRRAHQADAPEPRIVAQDVLIVRPVYDPQPLALPAGGAAFVAAILARATAADALAAALVDTPRFDLTALLSLLISAQAITDVETPQ
tara:strand:- start:54510 stop:55256 length:747 start_codon:yes stop_codon:yes gene_type:complete